jgi:GlpG protein
MRQIGSLSDSQQAQVFSDYLVTQGIAAQSEQAGDSWVIWVRDENHVETARAQLVEFEENSQDERYRDVTQVARRLREEERQRRREAAKNAVDMRQQWNRPAYRRAPLAITLIALSVGLSLFTGFGHDWANYGMRTLGFADMVQFVRTGDGLAQIRSGQIWRLVTPIFLHGSVIHLLFNMYWLYLFGVQIETRRGSLRFGGIVLGVAIFSNVLQYFMGPGPQFLGMSGVVYGLLAYMWVKIRFEPNSGFILSQSTFTFLVAIMVVMFGFEVVTGNPLGGLRVAHWAHLGGFIGGVVVGYAPIMLHRG